MRSGVAALWELIEFASINIVDFDVEQARGAIEAYAMYGKGINPIGLNFRGWRSLRTGKAPR